MRLDGLLAQALFPLEGTLASSHLLSTFKLACAFLFAAQFCFCSLSPLYSTAQRFDLPSDPHPHTPDLSASP
eukprot:689418-Rhodomonas_salina.1